jgi:hypothetical protein
MFFFCNSFMNGMCVFCMFVCVPLYVCIDIYFYLFYFILHLCETTQDAAHVVLLMLDLCTLWTNELAFVLTFVMCTKSFCVCIVCVCMCAFVV